MLLRKAKFTLKSLGYHPRNYKVNGKGLGSTSKMVITTISENQKKSIMPNFYLDIETTGLDPQNSKIITIQFAKLHDTTSQQIGELRILKEWESSEKEILKQFIIQSEITHSYPFSFISVGFNLQFEHNFFIQRCKANGLEPIDIFNKPHIDIKPFAVIMNNGQFKGSARPTQTSQR